MILEAFTFGNILDHQKSPLVFRRSATIARVRSVRRKLLWWKRLAAATDSMSGQRIINWPFRFEVSAQRSASKETTWLSGNERNKIDEQLLQYVWRWVG